MGPILEQPLILDRDTVRRIRDVFLAVGYTSPALEQILGVSGAEFIKTEVRKWPCLTRRAAGASPLATLARVFLFGTITDLKVFQAIVAPTSIDDWLRVGLIAAEGNSVRARWRLVPVEPHLYVIDAPWIVHDDERSLMMAPSPSSEKLGQLTIRRPCESAVDIGTGSGYQAFHAAAHCKHVVATDFSPRALGIAQFNAALNDLNVEFLTGDCFVPVEGRKFDLIVSNPPFVISPGGEQVYRDSGKPGDQFSERIVREAPSHLNPGGFAHILVNWVERTGEDWRQRLQSWVAGSGCDMYVLFAPPEDPGVYATAWSPESNAESANFQAKFDEYMAFFERERVERIYGGAVFLRKREGKNWCLFADAPGLIGTGGDAILGEFERFDYLNCTPDQQLLADRFRLSPDLHLTQTFAPGDGNLKAVSFNLKLRRGLTHGGQVGGNIFAIVSRIRPDAALGTILHEMATVWKQPLDVVVSGALPSLREMIFQGMLLPEPRS